MSARGRLRGLPLKPLPLPADPGQQAGQLTEAELCVFLLGVVGGTVPESVGAEVTGALVAMILTVMSERVQLQFGLSPDQGRAAALGYLAAKAQGGS